MLDAPRAERYIIGIASGMDVGIQFVYLAMEAKFIPFMANRYGIVEEGYDYRAGNGGNNGDAR